MQGKALAALVTLLAALALVACGGGDGGETTGGGEETSQAAGAEQIEKRADEIQEERQEESPGAKADAGQGKSGDSGSNGSSPAEEGSAPASPVKHSDSGGGAAQFETKGSDNSIQEFGQEGDNSARADAAAVLHAYLDARAAQRWEEACSYLSADVVATMEQFADAYAGDKQVEGCPDVLGGFNEAAGVSALRDAAKVDVGSLRMEGERGFLLYHAVGGADYAIPLVQEGGAWKLAAPEGTPLL